MAIRRVTRAGVGLAVGIIILAVIVFAGLWLVRERGDQARRQEAINIANQQLQAQSDEGVALNPDSSSNSSNNSGNSSSASNGSTSNTSNSSTANGATSATELPKTGPSDGLWILVAALLTFTAVSYVGSKRQLITQK